MNEMRAFIDQCLNNMINEYKNPHRVMSDYWREKESIQIYKGRELLELIQNADDEILEDSDREIKISFIGNELTVCNWGTPFSKDGLVSLMYSNLSPKRKKKEVIGNKGIGFRAILGWAENIKIHSGDLHVQFSHNHAQEMLHRIIPDADEQELVAATLAFPEWIDPAETQEFTTEISIVIRDDPRIKEDIQHQIAEINGDFLLFLNRTQGLTIQTDEGQWYFRREDYRNNKSKTAIVEQRPNEEERREVWFLKRKNGTITRENNTKFYSVVAAYKADGSSPRKQVIYSYFPTEADFPFPMLLHGTFNLNSDRNHLIRNDEDNKRILGQAASLMVEVALSIPLFKSKVSYGPLSLLVGYNALGSELLDYAFDEIMIDTLVHSKILPTVNGEYISFENEPIFYECELAKVVNGKGFGNLLQFTDNEDVIAFLKNNNGEHDCYQRSIGEDHVKWLSKWAKSRVFSKEVSYENAVCLKALNELMPWYDIELPRLLFDSNSHAIPTGVKAFLGDGSNIRNLPDFAHARFIHQQMQEDLKKVFQSSDSQLVSMLEGYNVEIYNNEQAIVLMNESIEASLNEGKTNLAWEKSVKLIQWIWYNALCALIQPPILVYVPTRTGGVRPSNTLYYGADYGNDLIEKLIGESHPEILIADLGRFLGGAKSKNLGWFLELLQVERFPKKVVKRIFDGNYESALEESLPYPITFDDGKKLRRNDSDKMLSVVCSSIDGLEEILQRSPTSTILEWIDQDSELRQILYNKTEKNAKLEICWGYLTKYRRYNHPFLSLLYWQFYTIPWIDIDGSRYSVRQCVGQSVGSLFEPVIAFPNSASWKRDGQPKNQKDKDIQVLKNLGMAESIGKLDWEIKYSLLLSISNGNYPRESVKSVYAAIANSDWEERPIATRYIFLSTGKVLCEDGTYQLARDVYHLDDKRVSKAVKKHFHIIALPDHVGADKIEKIFGAKKFTVVGEVTGEPKVHALNELFQMDLQNFIQMACCYSKDYIEAAKKLRELSVTLCSKIEARYGEYQVRLTDYDYISFNNKQFFVKAPFNIIDLYGLKSIDMGEAMAGILSMVFDSSTLFEQYRELYSHNPNERKELARRKVGSEAVFDEVIEALGGVPTKRKEFEQTVAELSHQEVKKVHADFQSFDFDNMGCERNCQLLIRHFTDYGIDITDYNIASGRNDLSLIKHYENMVQKEKDALEQEYESTVYWRLKRKGINAEKTLMGLTYSYQEPSKIAIEDSVSFDLRKAIIRHYRISQNVEKVDLRQIYEDHLEKWHELFGADKEYDDSLFDNLEMQSLLIYGEYETLKTVHDKHLNDQKDDDFLEVSSEEKNITLYETETTPTIRNHEPALVKHVRPGFAGMKNEKEKAKTGLLGERIVYERLRKEYADQVEWVSENAKKEGVNIKGSADYGYDIRYTDDSGSTIYVEVKASKGTKIAFVLSESEYEFAIHHSDFYELYFVSDVYADPQIYRLRGLIQNGALNEKNYTIRVSREYNIEAEIVKKESAQ